MAELLNSRNKLLNEAATRILGAAVYITSGVAASFTVPANATATVPGNITLTAVPSRYVSPQYTWSYRFGDAGSFITIANSDSPNYEVVGDSSFLTQAAGSNIVQYKVDVVETATQGANPSSFTITVPILRQGVNSVLGVLSNESQSVYADADGVVPAGTVIQSTLYIYNGTSDDSANWSASISTSTGISASLINGKTISVQLPINTLNGYVDITATRQGYPNVVKRFTLSKVLAGQDGVIGSDGNSTALVYAYKRSATAPTDNPGAVDYSFSTNSITTATLANSWQKTIPSGSDPLYVVVATASSSTSTDSIAADEWASPVLLVQNGTNGTNGLNTATVFLYARNNLDVPPDFYSNWDISKATFYQSFSVITQDSAPVDIFFKPDGLKMYIVGSNGDRVYEYNLSTAWNVSTATFLQSFSVSAQDATALGIFFKPDGLKMYIIGATNDRVYEYNLSTAWNVSTATFLQSFSVVTQDSSPQGIFFKPDGLKMYIVGTGGTKVYEYALGNRYTYTFSTKTLTGFRGSWNTVLPSEASGSVVWVTQATASSATDLDVIEESEWSTPQILAQKGGQGDPGLPGDPGVSPTIYEVSAASPVLSRSASNVLTPSNLVVNAFSTTGSTKSDYSGRFKIYEDSTLRYTSSTNQSTYTYIPTAPTTVSLFKVELYEAGGTTTLLDSQEIPVTVSGSSGITVSISNTAFTAPADSSGAVSTYAGSGTTIQVFEGSTALTYRTTLGTNLSSFTIGTPTLSVANAITVGFLSGSGTTSAIVANHSAMSTSVSAVVISYPITYTRANGAQATQTVTQSITKAPAGSIGVRGSRQIYDTNAAYTASYDFDGSSGITPGADSYAARATQLVATVTAGLNPTTPINGDTVTFTNGTDYVYTITHNGTNWNPPGTVIDGSLLVTGSVTASKINSNGLSIRDGTGNIILSAGSSLQDQAGNGSNLAANASLSANNQTWDIYTSTSGGRSGTIGYAKNQNGAPAGYGSVLGSWTGPVSAYYDDSLYQNTGFIACTPGERLEAQCKVQIFRGSCRLEPTFLDANNNFIGGILPDIGNIEAFGDSTWSTNLSDFTHLWGFVTVPAGAVKAKLEVRVRRVFNTATVFLYARNNSLITPPALPTSGSVTYTFKTKNTAGTIPSGWSTSIPNEANGSVVWVIQATAANTGTTDSILNTEWSTPTVLDVASKPVLVYAFKRSATAPTDSPGTVDYSYSTGTITTATLANGWQKTIPTGTDPLYVRVATANSSNTIDNIGANEWASAVLLSQSPAVAATDLYITQPYIGRAKNSQTSPTVWNDSLPFITGSNASTYIADAAIGAAQIGSISLVGTNNFNVKTKDSTAPDWGTNKARMEMDSRAIKIFDASGVLRVQIGDLSI